MSFFLAPTALLALYRYYSIISTDAKECRANGEFISKISEKWTVLSG